MGEEGGRKERGGGGGGGRRNESTEYTCLSLNSSLIAIE